MAGDGIERLYDVCADWACLGDLLRAEGAVRGDPIARANGVTVLLQNGPWRLFTRSAGRRERGEVMAVVEVGEEAGVDRFPAEGSARDEAGRRDV